MNHILREIKLSKLTDTPMSEQATMLVKFWDELWTDMKVNVDPSKGKIKCWKDGYNYYYFQQKDKNDWLCCNYDEVWAFFRDNLKLNYKETQKLIHQMMGETLNCVINTPYNSYMKIQQQDGETLNCVINTPIWEMISRIHTMGETLNCDV